MGMIQALYDGDKVIADINGEYSRDIYLQRGLRQGCSLSPMLFALYVVDWGKALEESGEGVKVGEITVAALFFADDVVLVASSAEGLAKLMEISEKEAEKMKLLISETKSMVMSDSDLVWELHNTEGEAFATLENVIEYKYLGLETHGSMTKTTVAKQKKMIAAARRYRGACKYLSNQGPDRIDVARCIWKNVAMPAITFGVESVLVSETTIQSLDRESARWAKETLNLPSNTPNVATQVLMGIPSFKNVIYSNQLKFFMRLRNMPKERYAAQALKENLEGNWKSPYIEHIYKIRAEVGMITFPPTEKLVEEIVGAHSIDNLNDKIERLVSVPRLEQICELSRARSAREGEDWHWINIARMGVWAIKRQLGANGRNKICSKDLVNDTDLHCLTECSKTTAVRKETGVSKFFTSAKLRGISLRKAYALFTHGRNLDGNEVSEDTYRERGRCVATIFQKAEGQSLPEGRNRVGYFLLTI